MRALRAFCNAISAQTCQALGVVGTRRGRGHKPPWSRSGWQEAADKTAEQLRVWAGCGEGDANSRCRFDDAGSDFDEMQLQRLELGDGQRLLFGNAVADPQQQPIGGCV